MRGLLPKLSFDMSGGQGIALIDSVKIYFGSLPSNCKEKSTYKFVGL